MSHRFIKTLHCIEITVRFQEVYISGIQEHGLGSSRRPSTSEWIDSHFDLQQFPKNIAKKGFRCNMGSYNSYSSPFFFLQSSIRSKRHSVSGYFLASRKMHFIPVSPFALVSYSQRFSLVSVFPSHSLSQFCLIHFLKHEKFRRFLWFNNFVLDSNFFFTIYFHQNLL